MLFTIHLGSFTVNRILEMCVQANRAIEWMCNANKRTKERTNRQTQNEQTSICYRICVVTAYNIFSIYVYIDFDIIFQQRLTFAINEWVHTNTRNTHRGVDLIFIKFLKRICYLIWIIITRILSSSWYLKLLIFPHIACFITSCWLEKYF